MAELLQRTITTAPPTGRAILLDRAKRQLGIDTTDTTRDTEVGDMCAQACRYVENALGYPVLDQTRQTHLRGFPTGSIVLGGGADFTVTQVQYYDTSGTQRTLASTEYLVDAVSLPTMIEPAPTKLWPAVQGRPSAVVVTWTAGWADDTEVPEDLTRAMCLLIGHWDQNREGVVTFRGAVSVEVAMAVNDLLWNYRIFGLS